MQEITANGLFFTVFGVRAGGGDHVDGGAGNGVDVVIAEHGAVFTQLLARQQ